MTSCLNVRENICAYIDNELGIDERLYFEKHIRSCRECKIELDEMSRIIGLCTDLPQQELPVDFRIELHEKLLAVANRQNINVKSIRKSKSFLFTKTFASIAAGILLIFLAGSFYRFGLLSPMKASDSMKNSAMAAEQPLADKMESFGAGDGADNAGVTDEAVRSFSASPAADVENFEVDRSAAVQNRETALVGAGQMLTAETANSKLMTITIAADEPLVQAEKVKLLALENSGDMAEKSAYSIYGDSATPIDQNTTIMASMSNEAPNAQTQMELDFIIPETQYDQFITALNTAFGEVNVQIGAFVTEDVTDALNSNIVISNEIDNRVQELQKKDSEKNTDEINKLKEEKEVIDIQIEKIRLGSDFVNVTVIINRK